MNELGTDLAIDKEQEKIKSKLRRLSLQSDDGALTVGASSYYGYYLDLSGNVTNEAELITKYRDMALQPELDLAIEDIINEALVFDNSGQCVSMNMDDATDIPEVVKKKLTEEFNIILKLLEFSDKGHDIFRNWYVDGRMYYHLLYDEKSTKKGISALELLDPRKVKKVREVRKEKDPKSGADVVKEIHEYFVYNEQGVLNSNINSGATSNTMMGTRIKKDNIVYVPSGLMDAKRLMMISYLHKAIKPFNQLRMVEDALVIYRLARAPERRLFYIDVGTMSTQKANQYVKSIQQNFRNKLVYDAQTGEIRDDRKFMSMLEDFWLPRREGGKGTEISTLPGGQNLGDIEDVLYFQKKLYKSLNIPISRLETETGFSLGRTTEITRDELKFAKFISKLRNKFTLLFDELMKIQCVMKNICTVDEWKEYKEKIWYDFKKDNNFDELKESELLRDRLDMLNQISPYIGQYFSRDWVRKNILKLTDEEINLMDKEIEKDKKEFPPEETTDQNNSSGLPPNFR